VTTVLICEDQATAGADLKSRVADIPGVDNVEVCSSSDRLVELYGLSHPELVLLGATAVGSIDTDAVTALLEAHPDAHVLMLAGRGDREAAAAAVAAGARGFLTRDGVDSGFTTAVAGAIAGRELLDGSVRSLPPLAERPEPVSLTERELQVLRGMAAGRSNAEIGRSLYLSEDTIKTHARRLFRKLGVNDRAKAVALGFRQGFVS
jgi:DNA-binding NarL/FixJ family response regulator